MRSTATRALPLLFALFAVACGGDPHEQALEEMGDAQEEFVSILEGIDTKADAEAAREDLRELMERVESLGERFAELEDPESPERAQELMEEFRKTQERFGERMQAVMAKLMNDPELMQAVSEVLSGVEMQGRGR